MSENPTFGDAIVGPSAAHSLGVSTTPGFDTRAASDGDSASHSHLPGLNLPANMRVDSSPNMHTYTAKMNSLSMSSHQFAEREIEYREQLNTWLQGSQQYPFVPDINSEEQKSNIPKGTIDSATFAVVQPTDAPPLLRHDLIQPPLNQHEFRDAIAKGMQVNPG